MPFFWWLGAATKIFVNSELVLCCMYIEIVNKKNVIKAPVCIASLFTTPTLWWMLDERVLEESVLLTGTCEQDVSGFRDYAESMHELIAAYSPALLSANFFKHESAQQQDSLIIQEMRFHFEAFMMQFLMLGTLSAVFWDFYMNLIGSEQHDLQALDAFIKGRFIQDNFMLGLAARILDLFGDASGAVFFSLLLTRATQVQFVLTATRIADLVPHVFSLSLFITCFGV
ncbi:hypothetical protein ACJX0J_037961 [Zea mays]